MQSFRNFFLACACLAIAAGAIAQEKSDSARPGGKSKQEKKKKAKVEEEKSGKEGDAAKEPEKMPFPLPIGHGGKGLKIPYLDGNARKTMNFVVGTAQRIDEDHVKMGALKIQTYDDEAQPDMSIDLPNAMLNLSTRVITAEKKVKIKREDFELTGNGMEFDTVSKQGTLKGNVRMLIYNLANEIDSDASAKPKQEPKPGE
jgi:hypothetical protein